MMRKLFILLLISVNLLGIVKPWRSETEVWFPQEIVRFDKTTTGGVLESHIYFYNAEGDTIWAYLVGSAGNADSLAHQAPTYYKPDSIKFLTGDSLAIYEGGIVKKVNIPRVAYADSAGTVITIDSIRYLTGDTIVIYEKSNTQKAKITRVGFADSTAKSVYAWDSDKLDGQQGSYYLDDTDIDSIVWSNQKIYIYEDGLRDSTVVIKPDSASYALDFPLTVGWGLDWSDAEDSAWVDTVDLKSYFYTEAEVNDNFVNESGDTITGNLSIDGNVTLGDSVIDTLVISGEYVFLSDINRTYWYIDGHAYGMESRYTGDASIINYYWVASQGKDADYFVYADGGDGSRTPYIGFMAEVDGKCYIITDDTLAIYTNGNWANYIQFQHTISDVPEITTVGDCDLKLSASSGVIQVSSDLDMGTNEILVDSILEKSAGVGIFIDGCRIKDGSALNSDTAGVAKDLQASSSVVSNAEVDDDLTISASGSVDTTAIGDLATFVANHDIDAYTKAETRGVIHDTADVIRGEITDTIDVQRSWSDIGDTCNAHDTDTQLSWADVGDTCDAHDTDTQLSWADVADTIDVYDDDTQPRSWADIGDTCDAHDTDTQLSWGDVRDTSTVVWVDSASVMRTYAQTISGDTADVVRSEIRDTSSLLNAGLTSDSTWSGITASVTVDSNEVGWRATLYLASDGHYEEADADTIVQMPCLVLALEAGTGTKKILLQGFVCDTAWDFTMGAGVSNLVYVSTTTGVITQTAPSASGDQVQVLGYCVSADCLYFSPNLILTEIN